METPDVKRVIVLTSSRADYGIYLPLLKQLDQDDFFKPDIVAFGSHLLPIHGLSKNVILEDGFSIYREIDSIVSEDDPKGIAESMAATIKAFAAFWEEEKSQIDLIICLGDRFEMYAAIAATVPFQLKVAHIHGGETTLGAIDNVFRHGITLMSNFHFVTHEAYAKRVGEITGSNTGIYNIGSLSLDSLASLTLLDRPALMERLGLQQGDRFILFTFHPETVRFEMNEVYTDELIKALEMMEEKIVITMPNNDTGGRMVRKKLLAFTERADHAFAFDSLGQQVYFSCMQHCEMIIGNSSSGIIESASFGKYVINAGHRQEGRLTNPNVFHTPIDANDILKAYKTIHALPPYDQGNVYQKGSAAKNITETLKDVL